MKGKKWCKQAWEQFSKTFDSMVENQGMDTLDDLPNAKDLWWNGGEPSKDTVDDLPIKRFAKDLLMMELMNSSTSMIRQLWRTKALIPWMTYVSWRMEMWRHYENMPNAQDVNLGIITWLRLQLGCSQGPMINERDWPNTFDGTDEFSHKCYGIISVHSAYIIRKDSTPEEKEDTDMDDPLGQMIERVPRTLTEVNDTIIKHHTFVTDN